VHESPDWLFRPLVVDHDEWIHLFIERDHHEWLAKPLRSSLTLQSSIVYSLRSGRRKFRRHTPFPAFQKDVLAVGLAAETIPASKLAKVVPLVPYEAFDPRSVSRFHSIILQRALKC
jgi:hypothetical protein